MRSAASAYESLPGFLRAYRAKFAVQVALVLCNSLLVVVPAFVGQRLIDDGVLQSDVPLILALGGVLVALALAQAAGMYAERVFSARFGESLVLRLRSDLYEHLTRQALGFFAYARPGAVVARIHGDVVGVQRVVAGTVPSAVNAVATLLFAGAGLLLLQWRAALAVLVLVPVLYVLAAFVAPRLREASQRELGAYADLDSCVAEQFTPGGAEVVRLHGGHARMAGRFVSRARQVRRHALTKVQLGAAFGAGVSTLVGLAGAAVYVAGGIWVVSGAMTMGTLVAVVALLARVYGPVTTLSTIKVDLVSGLVSFERVSEIMRFEPAITDPPAPRPIMESPPSVVLEQVSFTYPDPREVVVASLSADPAELGQADPDPEVGPRPEPARARGGALPPTLRGLDLTVAPGTVVGLVGPSGAGKSTLARLLTRSWDVTEGRILIGGTSIADLDARTLHRSVAVVTQETFLFNDTVRGNLLLADPDASHDDLVDACRAAQVWEVVERLPEGLDTIVGDRGIRVSGGERQRLALARLFLRVPPVVVLDEATSHLDTETEREVQRALRDRVVGSACLVIAHRLATVQDADLIVVIDEGRIVERGTHDELLRHDGRYRRLLAAQQRGRAHAVAP